MSMSMPPGTLRTASIQTKQYMSNTNGEEPKYRGNSVLPRKNADSFSEARIRDNSFAEPPGIIGGEQDLMENPPGVLMTSIDSSLSSQENGGFVIRRTRMDSQDSVRSSDMESIPRMSVTSLPSPVLPESMSNMNRRPPPPISSSSFTSSTTITTTTTTTKPPAVPRRETYTSPSSVPSSNVVGEKEEEKKTSSHPVATSIALDISLRISPSMNQDDVSERTRRDIAERLGVPLNSVTIVGMFCILSISFSLFNTHTHTHNTYTGTKDTTAENIMRTKRMSTMAAENTMLNTNSLRIRPIAKNPISRQHYQCLRAIYSRLDPERTNTLSTAQISNAIMSKDLNSFLFSPARLREGPGVEDLKERFDFVNQRNIAKKVSFDEFVAFCAMDESEWLAYLERVRVYHLVSYKCPSLTPSKIRIAIEVFSRYDANGNGVVYKNDFLPYFEGSAELAELLMLVPGDSIRASEFLTCCNHIAYDETDQEFADNLKMSR